MTTSSSNMSQLEEAYAALKNELEDRRKLELEILLSEAKFRDIAELVELTHDAMFVRDMQSKIVYWNKGAEEFYGWSKAEARGRTTQDLLHTVFPIRREEVEEQVIRTGSWEGDLIQTRRDGTKLTVSSRWALRKDPHGEPVAFLESNRDITLKRQVEERFRNLLEAAPDAMVIVDRTGRIQLVNAQTEYLFGYSRSELIGQSVDMLVPERFRGGHGKYRDVYANSPSSRPMGAGMELFALRKDGTEFPAQISLSPLQTGEGLLISSAIRDVTEQKQAEEVLKGHRRELAESNTKLAAANKELESFSYSVSHDLRAPLRSIDGFSHALMDDYADKLGDTGKDYLKRIRGATQRMGALIDDLLTLSRISRAQLRMQPVDLTSLATSVLDSLQAADQGRCVNVAIEKGLNTSGDPGLLRAALENLFGNAWKFTSKCESARIEFGKAKVNGAPAFFVRDNGAGFDMRYADRLFGAFQRLHSDAEYTGTGIGLATVQTIVQRHGGGIWAESELGKGATFYFTIGEKSDKGAKDEK